MFVCLLVCFSNKKKIVIHDVAASSSASKRSSGEISSCATSCVSKALFLDQTDCRRRPMTGSSNAQDPSRVHHGERFPWGALPSLSRDPLQSWRLLWLSCVEGRGGGLRLRLVPLGVEERVADFMDERFLESVFERMAIWNLQTTYKALDRCQMFSKRPPQWPCFEKLPQLLQTLVCVCWSRMISRLSRFYLMTS